MKLLFLLISIGLFGCATTNPEDNSEELLDQVVEANCVLKEVSRSTFINKNKAKTSFKIICK